MSERAHLSISTSGLHPFGIKIWSVFFFPVHCERRVFYTVSLALIPHICMAFTEMMFGSGCFCAARKFIVGLQLQIQLSRLRGKRTPFSPREGLYCLATILMHEVFPVIFCVVAAFTEACALSISDIYRWGRCSLNSVWFCEWRSLFFPPSRIEFHFIDKNKRPSGGSEWEEVLTPAKSYIYFKHLI